MSEIATESEVDKIGETAGSIWLLLNNGGQTKMADLVKQLDVPRDQVMQAIGWLAREHKIDIKMEARSRIVELIH